MFVIELDFFKCLEIFRVLANQTASYNGYHTTAKSPYNSYFIACLIYHTVTCNICFESLQQ